MGKVCANHFIGADMELKPNIASDRSWVWTAAADIADGEPKKEVLAIRFASPENAQKFKKSFDDARKTNMEIVAGTYVKPEKTETVEEDKKEEEKKEEKKEET